PGADQRGGAALELCEVARGVLVDEADRRTGEDVVELLEQQQLPQPLELCARILAAARDREHLGVVEALLRAAVAPLDERLRRVRAAVVLEIELAHHDRPLSRLRLEEVEELLRRAGARPRHALQVTCTPQVLE